MIKKFQRGEGTLFRHGSGGDHTIWESQFSGLGDEFNIFAVDLPGHGRSGGKGEKEVGLYVEWVKKFIKALGLDRPVLIGHSLGAAIALAFASVHGKLLSGLVPVSGGVKMPVNKMILEGIMTDPAATLNMTWKFAVSKQNREKLAYRLQKNLSEVKPEVIYGDYLSCDGMDLTNDIANIAIPTLLICGSEDKMTPASNCQFMQALIPGAEVALIETAGHLVMLEIPRPSTRLWRHLRPN